MKDLGKAQKVLGMRSRQEKQVVKLDQVSYVNDVLSRLKLTDFKAVSSPVGTRQRLVEPEKERYTPAENDPYLEFVGCVMYLAVCTRPAITRAFKVGSIVASV
jgi:hypothetical protein